MFDNFVVKKKEIVNKIEPIFIFIFKIISRERNRGGTVAHFLSHWIPWVVSTVENLKVLVVM